MKTKWDFDSISVNDKRFWAEIQKVQQFISKLIKEHGRPLWILTTQDGQVYHVNLLDADLALLYFTTQGHSDWVQIRKVKSLEIDTKARAEYDSKQDSTLKETFVKQWFNESPNRWRPHGHV